MGRLLLAALLCSALICAAFAATQKPKTLLMAKSESSAAAVKSLLQGLGHEVEYQSESENIQFKKFGEFKFDNLVLFGVTSEIPESALLEFVDSNRNLIVIGSPATDTSDGLSESLRNAAVSCGVHFSYSNVHDYFNNAGSADQVIVKEFTKATPVFQGKAPAKITYRGLGMQLDKTNPLQVSFATAQPTSITFIFEDDEETIKTPQLMGRQISIASGLQTRLGSRVSFIGSTELFAGSDATNAAFVKSIVEWTLGQRGALRHSNVKFGHADASRTGEFRIKDKIHYEVKIEEQVDGKWVPFRSNDVQLEFTMIDPYVRQSLKYDEQKNDGTYSLDFVAPDWYGIFKFHVDYRRAGYSLLTFSDQATVRPLRLNEYERFIPSAYPYYVGVFSCYGAFFIFLVLITASKKQN